MVAEPPSAPVKAPPARSALAALRALDGAARPGRWQYRIAAVEPQGRLTVPAGACAAFAADSTAAASCGTALVVRPGGRGGPPAEFDRRGRLQLPAWLRGAARVSGAVLVAWRHEPDVVLVIAPTSAVDELADDLAEGRR